MEQFGTRQRRFYKKKRTWLSLILLATLMWLGGFLLFMEAIPRNAQKVETPHDAIAVLTGGIGRLEAGLALLNNNKAQKLLVSGVHRAIDMKEIIRVFRQTPEIAECCLELGYEASDTIGNALEISQWAKAAGLKNLLVVTSSYHMPRALVEIRHMAPQLDLTPYPVFSPNVHIEDWFLWPGSTALVFGEYNKMLLSLIRTGILRLL